MGVDFGGPRGREAAGTATGTTLYATRKRATAQASGADMGAYTLADRATWANFKNRRNLEILTEGDPALFNSYGSILVNPAKWPQVRFSDAKIWHEWLTTKPGLDAITSYRIGGEQVFFPPAPKTTH